MVIGTHSTGENFFIQVFCIQALFQVDNYNLVPISCFLDSVGRIGCCSFAYHGSSSSTSQSNCENLSLTEDNMAGLSEAYHGTFPAQT